MVESFHVWEKASAMADQNGKRYQPEFKARVVELARAGRSISSLAKEFKITPATIRSWKLQADRDEGVRTDGLTSDEKKELAQLRRENARLREEREILSNDRAGAKTSTRPVGPRWHAATPCLGEWEPVK